jgi:hypothetical protein
MQPNLQLAVTPEDHQPSAIFFAPRNTRALIKFVQDTGRFPRLFYAL